MEKSLLVTKTIGNEYTQKTVFRVDGESATIPPGGWVFWMEESDELDGLISVLKRYAEEEDFTHVQKRANGPKFPIEKYIARLEKSR